MVVGAVAHAVRHVHCVRVGVAVVLKHAWVPVKGITSCLRLQASNSWLANPSFKTLHQQTLYCREPYLMMMMWGLVHCAIAVSTAVLGQSQGQCPQMSG